MATIKQQRENSKNQKYKKSKNDFKNTKEYAAGSKPNSYNHIKSNHITSIKSKFN